MLNLQETPEVADSASAVFQFPDLRRAVAYGLQQPAVSDPGATASLSALSDSLDVYQTAARLGLRPDLSTPGRNWELKCKRTLDIVASVLILIALLPLLLICCAAVLISSPGPIFFRHSRIGRNGQEFQVWKFRSMCAHPDQVLNAYLAQHPEAGEQWIQTHKLTNDPRVTSTGRFMRRFSLDELPQLWNVLQGDMSLIGPRPIVKAEIDKYRDAIAAYYAVRPGMTGLWQVSGRSDTTYDERVRLDRHYSEQWSLTMDASIFLKTFRVVFTGSGAY